MDDKDKAARLEKLKAFFTAHIELTRTAKAILMLKNAQRELPEEFGNDAQLGKFVAQIRKVKESIDELMKSESWNAEQTAFYEMARQGCDDWAAFFHSHALLGEFMTINEVIETLGAHALTLSATVAQLADELGIIILFQRPDAPH